MNLAVTESGTIASAWWHRVIGADCSADPRKASKPLAQLYFRFSRIIPPPKGSVATQPGPAKAVAKSYSSTVTPLRIESRVGVSGIRKNSRKGDQRKSLRKRPKERPGMAARRQRKANAIGIGRRRRPRREADRRLLTGKSPIGGSFTARLCGRRCGNRRSFVGARSLPPSRRPRLSHGRPCSRLQRHLASRRST